MNFVPKSLKDVIRTIAVLRDEIHKLHVRVGQFEELHRSQYAHDQKLKEQVDEDAEIPF